MPNRAECRCRCRSVTFEEADNRLVARWHVELAEADALASVQRKRDLRLERERLLTSACKPVASDALARWAESYDCIARSGFATLRAARSPLEEQWLRSRKKSSSYGARK